MNHIYIRLRRGGARSREEQEDQGGAPCLNDVGLLGGVGANTSAIFGDRSESAELRDAQTIARVGIEGCVGFSLTVSTKPCNTSRSSLPARASPTGEGGRSEADRSSRHKSSNDLEVILGRKVEGFDRPTVWARSRPFPRLCLAALNNVNSSGSSMFSIMSTRRRHKTLFHLRPRDALRRLADVPM